MRVLREFDPWNSPLCTCPDMYTLNPYTGCSHGCVYCYVDYVPDFQNCRPKKDIIKKLSSDLKTLSPGSILLSASSDPYPPIEKELKLTRDCLSLLSEQGWRVLIETKGDFADRDNDLLANGVVAVTITSIDDSLAKRLEPYAPPSSARIRMLERLETNKVVRIDPIIPGMNEEQEELIEIVASLGVKHVVSSTFKPRPQSWSRFTSGFPKEAEKLEKEYARIGSSWYLPESTRYRLMKRMQELCTKKDIAFSSCREGFPQLQTSKTCCGIY